MSLFYKDDYEPPDKFENSKIVLLLLVAAAWIVFLAWHFKIGAFNY